MSKPIPTVLTHPEHVEFVQRLEEMRNTLTESSERQSPEDAVRMAELKAMFSTFLPDATQTEFEAVDQLQRELRTRQRWLDHLLDQKTIDEAEFKRLVIQESDLCFRQCAKVLGAKRFEQLFGIDHQHAAFLNDNETPSQLLAHHQPYPKDRAQVIAALEAIDPQSIQSIAGTPWATRGAYKPVIQAIVEAERLYRSGDIHGSIELARSVIDDMQSRSVVRDARLYIVSWAYHIEGRGYEALGHWHSAESQYEASLIIKVHLAGWLPAAMKIATEVKLGGVETILSPVRGATRLQNVIEDLTRRRSLFRGNKRVYQNLLEDAQLKLAQSYLAMGDKSLAARHAIQALQIARRLVDRVGEIQSLYTLFQASAIGREECMEGLRRALTQRPEIKANPKVLSVLDLIG